MEKLNIVVCKIYSYRFHSKSSLQHKENFATDFTQHSSSFWHKSLFSGFQGEINALQGKIYVSNFFDERIATTFFRYIL
jgi:hypothetical protein